MSRYRKLTTICAAVVLSLGLAACGGGGSSTPPVTDTGDDTKKGTSVVPAPGACTDAACVKHYADALKDARDALAALLKTDYKQSDKDAADEAVAAALKNYNDAVAAQNKYAAAQPPTYALKAMTTALGSPTATHTVADAIDGGMPPENNEDYSKATWPVGTLSGFKGAVYEDSTAGTSIITYTNKSAPKSAKFKDYFPTPAEDQTLTAAPAAPAGYSYVSWGGGVTLNDEGVITFNSGASEFKGSVLSFAHGAGTNSTKTLTEADDTSTPNVNETKFSATGTFHGVTGTYECTGASGNHCSVTTNKKGVITGLAGNSGWTFTPGENAGNTAVAGALTDAQYLDFGYWVTTMSDPTSYSVGTFANATGATTGAVMGTLTSGQDKAITANYEGGAAGLYTRSAYAGTSDGETEAVGRFTAKASLMARFGTGDHTAVSLQNRISGTISNFMDGGVPIDATWSVDLDAINFSASTDGSFGGNNDDWSGQFVGGSDGTTPKPPDGVVGEFSETFSNGRVIGAFGATKQ